MPFSESIILEAWRRSGGVCECASREHSHISRCNKKLLELYRGDAESSNGWDVNSKSGSYTDLADCEIVCLDCLPRIHYL